MPTEYTAVVLDPNTPPPYMDPTNSIAKKKSIVMHTQMCVSPNPKILEKSVEHTGKRCEHCGQFAQQQPSMLHIKRTDVLFFFVSFDIIILLSHLVVIWPAPRPHDHIRPDNTKFIGYVLLIAVVIFLLFAACKYLP
ncbi:unnamed protein product [Strongylus vulgaris]|uniref:Uncharacterized protein n=1 Tax=Strongylus vulgaris TaxID=40348 RepID=A0A3P7IQ68_STRVU|nr:unnamed protein product [Strongylus vulgaris]